MGEIEFIRNCEADLSQLESSTQSRQQEDESLIQVADHQDESTFEEEEVPAQQQEEPAQQQEEPAQQQEEPAQQQEEPAQQQDMEYEDELEEKKDESDENGDESDENGNESDENGNEEDADEEDEDEDEEEAPKLVQPTESSPSSSEDETVKRKPATPISTASKPTPVSNKPLASSSQKPNSQSATRASWETGRGWNTPEKVRDYEDAAGVSSAMELEGGDVRSKETNVQSQEISDEDILNTDYKKISVRGKQQSPQKEEDVIDLTKL